MTSKTYASQVIMAGRTLPTFEPAFDRACH
ncbi:hypothetical protein J2S93_004223 [Arthrobacter bambusae]|uniref:Uncharacterized protein n=1 Tax=Arthrobacter bambusae TaxID=1338426 RepID=A0ABT9XB48_9MICC|nr:hypothetical protein [Arthrobacter bambusae]MDQ0182767.1 hypothetical protein [Arthrobacter bambusae]